MFLLKRPLSSYCAMDQTWCFHRHKFIHENHQNRDDSNTRSFTPKKSHFYWSFPVKTSCEKCHIWPITLQLHQISCNQKAMGQRWHFSKEVIHTKKSGFSVFFLGVKLPVQDSSLFSWFSVDEFMSMKTSRLVHRNIETHKIGRWEVHSSEMVWHGKV